MIPEILQLAFLEIDDFTLLTETITYKKYQEKLKQGKIQISLSYDKKNDQFLYSKIPVANINYCIYGSKGGGFSEDELRKHKFLFKAYDFINKDQLSVIHENYISQKYYMDRFEMDTDQGILFLKVVQGEYDWILMPESYYNKEYYGKVKGFDHVKKMGCLINFDIYVAIDKGYLRSWELKKKLDDFFEKFVTQKDYKILRDVYRLRLPGTK